MEPLSRQFSRFLSIASGALDLDELEHLLAAHLQRAVSTWPGVDVSPEEFVRHLAERCSGPKVDPAALRSLHAADLYLAAGCTLGRASALVELDRRFLSEVPRFVRRLNPTPEFGDEVTQALRRRLLVCDGDAPPKIGAYAGRGPLGGWLRVVAVRTAKNLIRDTGPRRFSDSEVKLAAGSPATATDPEMLLHRGRAGREFKEAFEETLASLTAREKNILSLYFLEGLASSAIGAMYGVTGAAVRSWLKEWRRQILAGTRRRLKERLQLNDTEVESVLGAAPGQVDVSIARLLKPSP